MRSSSEGPPPPRLSSPLCVCVVHASAQARCSSSITPRLAQGASDRADAGVIMNQPPLAAVTFTGRAADDYFFFAFFSIEGKERVV